MPPPSIFLYNPIPTSSETTRFLLFFCPQEQYKKCVSIVPCIVVVPICLAPCSVPGWLCTSTCWWPCCCSTPPSSSTSSPTSPTAGSDRTTGPLWVRFTGWRGDCARKYASVLVAPQCLYITSSQSSRARRTDADFAVRHPVQELTFLGVYRDRQKEWDKAPFVKLFLIIWGHPKSSFQYASCIKLWTACVHSKTWFRRSQITCKRTTKVVIRLILSAYPCI